MSIIKDLMTECLKIYPAATAMDVARYVHEKQGKVAPTSPLSGTTLRQVKEELGIKVREKRIVKASEPKESSERREYKRKTQRLYYSLWECSLEGISSSSERDLVDKLKDFIGTLNNIRHTKFELLEIANPRRIEVRESNG